MLALALVAACKPDTAVPVGHDARPPAPAPVPADATAALDAEAFALFDHLAIRTVKRPTSPRRVQLPAGALRTVKLAVVGEDAAASFGQLMPVVAGPPAWMQTRLGTTPITRFQPEPDGSSLAVAGQIVILVDRDHRAEVGLDFGELRARLSPEENPEAFEGGDHAFTAFVLGIRQIHRVGALVVVATSLGTHEQDVLIGVDAGTGEVAWVSRAGVAAEEIVIAGGHAVASAQIGGHWALVAIALDTGAIDASVRTKTGPYRLSAGAVSPDGVLSIGGEIALRTDRVMDDVKPSKLVATATLAPP